MQIPEGRHGEIDGSLRTGELAVPIAPFSRMENLFDSDKPQKTKEQKVRRSGLAHARTVTRNSGIKVMNRRKKVTMSMAPLCYAGFATVRGRDGAAGVESMRFLGLPICGGLPPSRWLQTSREKGVPKWSQQGTHGARERSQRPRRATAVMAITSDAR